MTEVTKWYCFLCLREHDVIDGVVQCDEQPYSPQLTEEEFRKIHEWVKNNPIDF